MSCCLPSKPCSSFVSNDMGSSFITNSDGACEMAPLVDDPRYRSLVVALSKLEVSVAGMRIGGGGFNELTDVVESVQMPEITFTEYMAHVIGCTAGFVQDVPTTITAAAAGLALMLRVRDSGVIPVVPLTLHRLGLACFWVAQKVVCDDFLSCPLMAEAGGVSELDVGACERAVLLALDWDVAVRGAEVEAVLGNGQPQPAARPAKKQTRPAASARSAFRRVLTRAGAAIRGKFLH
eukprot:TRINITY_DN5611_c2_g1_i1.p1 TRINITY_DN5611_c2_g1~~TRINITY_DN5611_c2_g1_i1.p1  ORF type:complete len:259 (+),score=88.46 TRINITY_DN5611_c2_g1_i1:72-779(+)